MNRRKKIALAMSLFMLANVASSCNKTEETELTTTTTTTTTTEATTEATTTTEPIVVEDRLYDPSNPLAVNPITGIQDMDPENVGMRSVAVVVNNCHAAMPQRGISHADTIYEYETEGGQTRLLCLFADVNDIPEIGSLRSARIVASDLAAGTNSIFIHYGRNPRVPEHLNAWGIDHIDGNECSAGSNSVRSTSDGYVQLANGLFFWRDSTWLSQRAIEHTAVTDGAHISEGIDYFGITREAEYDPEDLPENATAYQRAYPERIFNLVPGDSVDIANGTPCYDLNVYFSGTNDDALFEYDEETGLYYKSQYGSEQIDLTVQEENAETLADDPDAEVVSEQLAVTNVIVLYANICGHGDTTVDVYFEDGGEGYYFSNGRMVHLTWVKDEPTDKITLYNDAGEEVEINRGVSYVCIVDQDYFGMSSYSEEADGEMYALGVDREDA